MLTSVVNIKKETPDVYIGRPSPFGNPHPIGWCPLCRESHSRRTCIEAFRKGFRHAIQNKRFRDQLEQLRGKKLGCYCKPLACHGDVIVEYLERTGEYAEKG